MHLCLTVECITSGLHLSVFELGHPPPPPQGLLHSPVHGWAALSPLKEKWGVSSGSALSCGVNVADLRVSRWCAQLNAPHVHVRLLHGAGSGCLLVMQRAQGSNDSE